MYVSDRMLKLASRGEPRAVKSLLRDEPRLLDAASGEDNRTLLWEAANAGRRDDKGRTALHNAARAGFANVTQVLLAAGSEVNPGMDTGETPLALAVKRKRHAAAELLRMQGRAL